jgi:hypothetical protein
MFQWYQDARECYAYLSDVARLGSDAPKVKDQLKNCRWFTRGWTLQELIAPKKILFYNQVWQCIGTKSNFVDTISSITNIDKRILLGKRLLEDYSVATRMSWAAHRDTKRIEDLAYCLMGIFGVNMPFIYGEGPKAFLRLQEEIIKHDNDLTIFAWDRWQDKEVPWTLFSPSPSGFANKSGVTRHNRSLLDAVFSVTNRGLRIENHAVVKMVSNSDEGNSTRYCLNLGDFKDWCSDVYLQLAKVGPNVFVRHGPLLISADNPLIGEPISSCHIHPSSFESFERRYSSWKRAALFAQHDQLKILAVRPESHWDDTNRLFFGPLYGNIFCVLAALCEVNLGASTVSMLVCLRFSYFKPPVCKLFDATDHNRLLSYLFDYPRVDDLSWDDFGKRYPEVSDLDDTLRVTAGGSTFVISMTVKKEEVLMQGGPTNEIFCLSMEIKDETDCSSAKGGTARGSQTRNGLQIRLHL